MIDPLDEEDDMKHYEFEFSKADELKQAVARKVGRDEKSCS